MTTRIARWCFSSLSAAALLVAATHAEAQCPPGTVFCAQVSAGASVSIGGYLDVAPPPPPVYIQQPPPVVYAPPPPPPVVIYQPAPPAPPPQVMYQQYQPPPPVYMQPPMMQRPPREHRFGLHLGLGAMATDRVAMGGVDFALRLRPNPHLALEIGVGTYGGQDYNQLGRMEIPLTLNALFFFNPGHVVQVYALLGIGTSWAHVDPGSGSFTGSDYTYLGGQVGLGLEFRLSQWFALNLDARGFLRGRIDGGGVPEFTEPGTGRTTDTSIGVYGTVGATLYL